MFRDLVVRVKFWSSLTTGRPFISNPALMDVDEVASTVTFRGLPGPYQGLQHTLNISESVRLVKKCDLGHSFFTIRTSLPANNIYIIESGVEQYPKLIMAQARNYSTSLYGTQQ